MELKLETNLRAPLRAAARELLAGVRVNKTGRPNGVRVKLWSIEAWEERHAIAEAPLPSRRRVPRRRRRTIWPCGGRGGLESLVRLAALSAVVLHRLPTDLAGRREDLGLTPREMATGTGMPAHDVLSIEGGAGTDDECNAYAAWLDRIERWRPPERRYRVLRARNGLPFA